MGKDGKRRKMWIFNGFSIQTFRHCIDVQKAMGEFAEADSIHVISCKKYSIVNIQFLTRKIGIKLNHMYIYIYIHIYFDNSNKTQDFL